MKKIIIFAGSLLFVFLLLIGIFYGGGKANPKPEIIFPEHGSIQSGIIILTTEQKNERIPHGEIQSVRFQYSNNQKDWNLIQEYIQPFSTQYGNSSNIWETGWDISRIPSGAYAIRTAITTKSGKVGFSPALNMRINKEPIAMASAALVRTGERDERRRTGATIMFDGSGSSDPDGTVTKWTWDFGDGTMGTNEIVEHTYADTTRMYSVLLTVSDDLGTTQSNHYRITWSFAGDVIMVQEEGCICESITLRGDNLPAEKDVFGPDGEDTGGDSWGAVPGQRDGGKLGPLNDNPGNGAAGGEKEWTGYAFEVVVKVKGKPELCKEMQLVKSTTNGDDQQWKGTTADLDQNGTDAGDIDVSTNAKCVAEGGTWDTVAGKCTLTFPHAGGKYGPDVPENDPARYPQGAYEHPYSFKKHPDHKIIWYDAPRTSGYPNGTKDKADFVSYVRGTDGKYCYVKSTLDAEKKAGQDKENLTEMDSAVGVNSIPGVP